MQVKGIFFFKRLSVMFLAVSAIVYLVMITQPPAPPKNALSDIGQTSGQSGFVESTFFEKSGSDTITAAVALPNEPSPSQPFLKTDPQTEGFSPAAPAVKQSEPVKSIPVARTASVSVSRSTASVSDRVGELVDWSKVQTLFARGETASLVDVDTGKTFRIKRKGGTNHADCEPLAAADTAVMKSLYGSWSWTRRAVVLVIEGQRIAASMAGMPHGTETISGNNFSGHFDLHFLGSMTHGSSYTKTGVPMVDPDHQAMVRKAAGR